MSHTAQQPASAPVLTKPIVAATFMILRLYELGEDIDLHIVQQTLGGASEREPRVQQRSIHVPSPPVNFPLGPARAELCGMRLSGEWSARIYDLGVVAVELELTLPEGLSWSEAGGLIDSSLDLSEVLEGQFLEQVSLIEQRILPAIRRPGRGPFVEDYALLAVTRLADTMPPAAQINDPALYAAALGERSPLSSDANALITRMSYGLDDLALLTWIGALIIEPDREKVEDAAVLLEFANAKLLELRSYDAHLNNELPMLQQRIQRARRRLRLPLVRPTVHVLNAVQTLVAEIHAEGERVENAFKVTEDVYWSRFYSAALSVLKVQLWRSSIDTKLHILREGYTMLRDEAEIGRALVLEWIIILLIALEIIMPVIDFIFSSLR